MGGAGDNDNDTDIKCVSPEPPNTKWSTVPSGENLKLPCNQWKGLEPNPGPYLSALNPTCPLRIDAVCRLDGAVANNEGEQHRPLVATHNSEQHSQLTHFGPPPAPWRGWPMLAVPEAGQAELFARLAVAPDKPGVDNLGVGAAHGLFVGEEVDSGTGWRKYLEPHVLWHLWLDNPSSGELWRQDSATSLLPKLRGKRLLACYFDASGVGQRRKRTGTMYGITLYPINAWPQTPGAKVRAHAVVFPRLEGKATPKPVPTKMPRTWRQPLLTESVQIPLHQTPYNLPRIRSILDEHPYPYLDLQEYTLHGLGQGYCGGEFSVEDHGQYIHCKNSSKLDTPEARAIVWSKLLKMPHAGPFLSPPVIDGRQPTVHPLSGSGKGVAKFLKEVEPIERAIIQGSTPKGFSMNDRSRRGKLDMKYFTQGTFYRQLAQCGPGTKVLLFDIKGAYPTMPTALESLHSQVVSMEDAQGVVKYLVMTGQTFGFKDSEAHWQGTAAVTLRWPLMHEVVVHAPLAFVDLDNYVDNFTLPVQREERELQEDYDARVCKAVTCTELLMLELGAPCHEWERGVTNFKLLGWHWDTGKTPCRIRVDPEKAEAAVELRRRLHTSGLTVTTCGKAFSFFCFVGTGVPLMKPYITLARAKLTELKLQHPKSTEPASWPPALVAGFDMAVDLLVDAGSPEGVAIHPGSAHTYPFDEVWRTDAGDEGVGAVNISKLRFIAEPWAKKQEVDDDESSTLREARALDVSVDAWGQCPEQPGRLRVVLVEVDSNALVQAWENGSSQAAELNLLICVIKTKAFKMGVLVRLRHILRHHNQCADALSHQLICESDIPPRLIQGDRPCPFEALTWDELGIDPSAFQRYRALIR